MMLSLSTDGTIKTDDNVITSITVEEGFFISLFFYRNTPPPARPHFFRHHL